MFAARVGEKRVINLVRALLERTIHRFGGPELIIQLSHEEEPAPLIKRFASLFCSGSREKYTEILGRARGPGTSRGDARRATGSLSINLDSGFASHAGTEVEHGSAGGLRGGNTRYYSLYYSIREP